jgi:hypothetical protein
LRIISFDYLATFSSQWLNMGPELESDLDGNGAVDFKDFSMLAGDWFEDSV